MKREFIKSAALKMTAAAAVLMMAGSVFAAGTKDTAAKTSAGSSSGTVQNGVLKIGTEIGYPPMEYFAEDGKTPAGFDIELGKAVAARLGMKAEFVDTAWDGIFAGLDTKKYDCIMSSVTITDERKAKYDFSVPYIGNGQSIVLKKGSKFSASRPEELAGLRVGYQAECTSDFFMTKWAEKGLKFQAEEYDKVLNCFDDLKVGRCDAVVADALVSVSYISQKDSPFVMTWQGTPNEFFGVTFKKGNTVLQEKVNKVIADMLADGTLKKISMDTFNADLVSSSLNK